MAIEAYARPKTNVCPLAFRELNNMLELPQKFLRYISLQIVFITQSIEAIFRAKIEHLGEFCRRGSKSRRKILG